MVENPLVFSCLLPCFQHVKCSNPGLLKKAKFLVSSPQGCSLKAVFKGRNIIPSNKVFVTVKRFVQDHI